MEAIYDCKLPLYYNKSLYSEILRKLDNVKDNSVKDLRIKNSTDDNNTLALMNEESMKQFQSNINELITRRCICTRKVEHLKEKKIKFIMNGQMNVVQIYHQEIHKCYAELQTISDDLIFAFQNYE